MGPSCYRVRSDAQWGQIWWHKWMPNTEPQPSPAQTQRLLKWPFYSVCRCRENKAAVNLTLINISCHFMAKTHEPLIPFAHSVAITLDYWNWIVDWYVKNNVVNYRCLSLLEATVSTIICAHCRRKISSFWSKLLASPILSFWPNPILPLPLLVPPHRKSLQCYPGGQRNRCTEASGGEGNFRDALAFFSLNNYFYTFISIYLCWMSRSCVRLFVAQTEIFAQSASRNMQHKIYLMSFLD